MTKRTCNPTIHRLLRPTCLRSLFVVFYFLASGLAQPQSVGDPWDEMAGRADQLMICEPSGVSSPRNPAAVARDLYERAIQLIDTSKTSEPERQQRRGAFRALATKRIDELTTQRDIWTQAYERAAALLEKRSLEQARQVLTNAHPSPCWVAAQVLLEQIDKGRAEAATFLQQGDSALERAQRTFNLSQAGRLFRDSISAYTKGRRSNADEARFVERMVIAQQNLDAVTSPSKHEILLLTNPGGARAVLKGDGTERVCASTPCKWPVDSAYFQRGGGNFLDSKRLTEPLIAQIEKPGYRPITVELSRLGGTLKFKVPGRTIEILYYYVSENRFQIELQNPGQSDPTRR